MAFPRLARLEPAPRMVLPELEGERWGADNDGDFIFYRTEAERAAGLPALAEALRTDPAWEREKTRINDLAEAWDRAGRRAKRLLTSDERLREAEAWRDAHPASAPPPTATQLAYVAESRRRSSRRQRWIRAGLGTVATVTSLAAAAAVFFGLQAEERRVEVERPLPSSTRSLLSGSRRPIAGRPARCRGRRPG